MVSVCIATYNGEKYIAEQLKSILNQLSLEDEIVISDDGSNDNTVAIIKKSNDKRINLINSNKKQSGPILNFENALKHASGEIIFLCDQDDIWMDNKINKCLLCLKECDLVITNAVFINSKGTLSNQFFFNSIPNLNFFYNIIFNNYFGATMAFKRNVLIKSLPFPSIIPMHDQWIGIIGARYFKVKYIEDPLIYYRRHDNNASYCGEKSRNNFITKIRFRVCLIIAFINFIVNEKKCK